MWSRGQSVPTTEKAAQLSGGDTGPDQPENTQEKTDRKKGQSDDP
jgi:hypothetical protein